MLEALPFRFAVAGEDRLEAGRILSISFKVEGLAHLDHDVLHLEWAGTESVDDVNGLGVSSTVNALPHEEVELPREVLGGARLRWRYVAPRLVLSGRRLDTFDGLPGAQPGRLVLKVRRRHAALAEAYASELRR